ncbi:3-oxoacyl-ACP reductase [Candidatus Magnetobacterium bavaricum]|uniref:3-oxoacyl-ACP reductase n=1 Tax=Candidatus Magnetobacterium bavaricum TaxID=29290 RepID=A0A0F3GHG9_9BACT|nr:3-oxoacyl-ACP reductase [Candidatus Magnetobacterium bavaricum]
MITTEKTVLITGATSGIGLSIALLFAENGWNIICHYNSLGNKALEIKDVIQGYGVECILIKANFLLEKDINDLISKLYEFKVHSIINNAGTLVISKHFSELSLEQIKDCFMVNVFAHMLLTSKLFNQMKNINFGRIVNISSIAAHYGGSTYSMHYGSAKLAMEGITKTISKEGAKYNILCNTVRPGLIDTEFHSKYPKDMEKRISMVPVKRIGTTKEIADMVYYLGSDKNTFITNQTITIAGGE